jgi:hypothetical protein
MKRRPIPTRLHGATSQNGSAMAQAVSRRPLTKEAWVRVQQIHVGFVEGKVALGLIRLLRFSPDSIIPLRFSTLAYRLGDEPTGSLVAAFFETSGI